MNSKIITKIEDVSSYIPLIQKGFTIAVIPARGSSKTIKNKNIRDLNGLPLIAYSINHAKSSKQIKDVYVSSDSEEILKIGEEYGAKPVKRADELSNDIIHAEPAIIDVLLKIAQKEKILPECTVMLQPTSPIREVKLLDQAILNVLSGKYSSSISGTKTHHFIWEKDLNNNWVPPYELNKRPRRQDFEQVKETGSFFVFNTIDFLKTGDRINKPVDIQITSENESYEIDTLVDWIILEKLIEKL